MYVCMYACMYVSVLKLYLILYIINEILIMLLANLAYNSQIYIYKIFESLLTLSKFFRKFIKDFLFISLRSMLYLILKALYI